MGEEKYITVFLEVGRIKVHKRLRKLKGRQWRSLKYNKDLLHKSPAYGPHHISFGDKYNYFENKGDNKAIRDLRDIDY